MAFTRAKPLTYQEAHIEILVSKYMYIPNEHKANATWALPLTVINHAKMKHDELSSQGNDFCVTATQLREVGSQNLVSRLPIWPVRHASSSKQQNGPFGPCDMDLQHLLAKKYLEGTEVLSSARCTAQ